MRNSIDLQYPFTGHWRVQNSPANRVPSHGTESFATSYAIDFVPVTKTGRTAPMRFRSFFRPEAPDVFPGFGRPLIAPITGTVVATHDQEPDHAAYRGFPSVRYALTQQTRAAAGWLALAGNHVLIESHGIFIALCHLQRASVAVEPNQRLNVGEFIGRCGNSGNSTQPHVHLQAMDNRDPTSATPIRIAFNQKLPRNGELLKLS